MKCLLPAIVAGLLVTPAFAQEADESATKLAAENATEVGSQTSPAPTSAVPKAVDEKTTASEISDSSSNYKCEHGGMIRRIAVVAGDVDTDPNANACEVKYTKETEKPGEEQILWTAKTDLEYCIEKAAGLANKLEGFGWSCASE